MVAPLDFRLALKQRGLRMTPQRQLILDAVASLHGHISADQVYQQVISQFPDVNVTTVYRTLEVLEELGLVRPGDKPVILVWPDRAERTAPAPVVAPAERAPNWRGWFRLFVDAPLESR